MNSILKLVCALVASSALWFVPLTLHAADNANDGNTHDTRGGPTGTDDGGTGGGDCDDQHSGSPVILKNGEFIWNETDVRLKGRPALVMSRYYRSLDARDGYFGKGWSTHCERALIRVVTYVQASSTDTALVPRMAYVYRLANGRRYTFVEDANGNFETPSGIARKSLVVDSAERVSLLALNGQRETYNARGQLVSETDRYGNVVTYSRNANGELIKISDQNDRFLQLVHDSTGHVSTVTDHTGRRWQYAYNPDGTLASVTDPLGGQRSYSYTPIQRPASAHTYLALSEVRDETSRVVTTVTYDSEGKVESYSQGENVFTYSTSRQFIVKTDSVNSRWSYLLDEDGHKVEIWPPVNRGTPQKFDYDDNGEVFKYTDMLRSEFVYERDGFGRVISITTPDGTTAYSYTGNTDFVPAKVVSPSGRETTFTRNAKGNPLTVTDASGATSRFEWSESGDLLSHTDAENQKTTRSYDAAGLLVSITDALGRSTSYRRDARGNVVAVINPLGDTTTLEFDVLDRMVLHTDPSGAQTRYAYDASGRTVSVTDAVGGVTQYEYDAFGRLITETLSDGSQYQYGWSVDNLLVSVTDRNDTVTSYVYDTGKRLTSRSATAISDTYRYDVLGRLEQASGRGGSVRFTYDALGRALTEITSDGTVRFSYNNEGEAITADVHGDEIAYSYDARGLVGGFETTMGAYSLTRDKVGRILSRVNPNGASERFSYDAGSQIIGVDYTESSQNSLSYQLDDSGQLMSMQDSLSSLAQTFTFDANGRLQNRTDAQSFGFTYDAIGNRLDNMQVYNSAQQLLQDAQYSYSYDLAGNRSERIDNTTGAIRRYTYDALNRLLSVEESSDGVASFVRLTAYTYDPLGRRVQKQTPTTTTRFLWQGDRLVSETVNRRLSRRFRYAGNLTPLEFEDANGNYHVHVNRIGEAVALTDQSGQVVWRRTLSPYGRDIGETNTDVDGDGIEVNYNQTFTGQFRDESTGYDYNYLRDYDSYAGRYLTPDPIGLVGGVNRYAYAGGNPAMLNDPHGMAICGGLCIGAVVVGGVIVHYIRNNLNEPVSFQTANESWQQLAPEQAIFHTMGAGNEGNIKFISPDGHSEAVFYGDGTLVTDPSVYGTYNFVGPGNLAQNIGHGIFDVFPYFLLGNTPGDIFNFDRFTVLFDGGDEDGNGSGATNSTGAGSLDGANSGPGGPGALGGLGGGFGDSNQQGAFGPGGVGANNVCY